VECWAAYLENNYMNLKTFSWFIFIVSAVFIFSCSSGRDVHTKSKIAKEQIGDTIRIANDSLDYEILIFEQGFNTWLITQKPKTYYSVNYLESKNIRFTSEYNRRVFSSPYSQDLYIQEINYEPTIHYGLDVNYILYNYFIFFQEKYNQNL